MFLYDLSQDIRFRDVGGWVADSLKRSTACACLMKFGASRRRFDLFAHARVASAEVCSASCGQKFYVSNVLCVGVGVGRS